MELECISRKYEEDQRHPPRGHERACVHAAACLSLRWHGFVMKEFLTPNERERVARSGQPNPEHRPCIMCIHETMRLLAKQYL
jgi:hypothetical protein